MSSEPASARSGAGAEGSRKAPTFDLTTSLHGFLRQRAVRELRERWESREAPRGRSGGPRDPRSRGAACSARRLPSPSPSPRGRAPRRRRTTALPTTTTPKNTGIIFFDISTCRSMASGGIVRPLFSARFSMDSRIVRSMSIFGATTSHGAAVEARRPAREGSHHVGRATRRRKVSEGRENVPTTADTGEIGASAAGTAGDASLTCSVLPRPATRPWRRPGPRGRRG